ncbi:MAG TPA: hypothetical protein VMN58_09280 [Acidimicrobiales bacterium]|nr:hypothetical protein [Acidimicrobiales bacterium]
MSSGWPVERARGPARRFHDRPLHEPASRLVSVLEVDRPALVLGSTQSESSVDVAALEAAGVTLVRRRSGGGAVLLVPGESIWVDVVVPRGDDVWDDDVGRSFHWLGGVWAAALGDLGIVAEVHTGGLICTPWSRLVCFGGLGPGEISVDGRKAVGLSQRRARHAARFQCALLRRWSAAEVVGLLALDDDERARAVAGLDHAAVGLPIDAEDVVGALLDRLP